MFENIKTYLDNHIPGQEPDLKESVIFDVIDSNIQHGFCAPKEKAEKIRAVKDELTNILYTGTYDAKKLEKLISQV